MESKNYLEINVKELTKEDLLVLNGGSFAYDLGFFIRECVIYVVNGGYVRGEAAMISDVSQKYIPLH